jgi:CRP-like cAMP-binding protein
MAVTADQLRQVPLFSKLSDKELRSVAEQMRERSFSAGDTMTEEGASGVGFFVIDSGEAQLSKDGEIIATLGAGDHFGEIALLSESPRTATLVATTDLHCFGLTSWQFRPLVENDARIAWQLLQSLAKMFERS